MSDVLALLLGGVLVHNLVLGHLCGVERVAAIAPRPLQAVLALSLFATLAAALVAPLSWTLEHLLLRAPGLSTLRPATALLASAAGLGALHGGMRLAPPALRALWRRHPLPAAPDAALLGVALLAPALARDPAQALLFGAASGLGLGLVLVLFAGLQTRLAAAQVPAPLRGAPLALLSLALIGLAWAGLAGIGDRL